jgi:hypothetical protein
MGRGFILVLAASGMAVCGALATGPGLAFATSPATARPADAARPAAAAAAPAWGTAQELPGVASLTGDVGAAFGATLSCSSPGNCAVGGNYVDASGSYYVVASAFVAGERNGTWGRAIEVPGLAALNAGDNAELNSLSCTSAGDCSAGGYYSPGTDDATGDSLAFDAFVLTENDGTWGRAIEVPGTAALNAGDNASVSSLSCWSPGDCVAAGQYALGGTVNGTADTQAFVATEKDGTWDRATGLPGLAALNTGEQAAANSISCTAGGNCSVGGSYFTASGQHQAFAADEVAGTWQPAEELPGTSALNVNGNAGVSDVECSSPGNCGAQGYVAGGNYAAGFFASEINGTWRTTDVIPNGVSAFSLACPSAGNCVAGGMYNTGVVGSRQDSQAFMMTELNGAWGGLETVPGLAGLNIGQIAAIGSVSCSAPGVCAAGGYYAGVKSPENQIPGQGFVVTQTDGTWGRAQDVPGILGLTATDVATVNAVSCVAPHACTATGIYGAGDVFVVSTGAPTATTESLSAAKVTDGREQAERASVVVTAKTGGRPTGTVIVKAGSATLCIITLRSGNGACTLTARRLRPGRYRLTAAYPGSADFAPSVSRAMTLTVVK